MAQSEPPDDRLPRASGSRFHLEQSAHDRASSAARREPTALPARDGFVDRLVPRPVAADASGDRGAGAQVPFGDPGSAGPPSPFRAGPPSGEPAAHNGAPPDPEHEREVVRRVFDERTGDEWRVFERDTRRIPGSRGARCLFFDGEGIVRRVWQYPADWQSLPAAALLALMDRPPFGDR